MPASNYSNMPVDSVLAILRQNPSFNQLPADWQTKLAGQVHDNGLQATLDMNGGWLGGNSNNPVAGALGSWLGQATSSLPALENGTQQPIVSDPSVSDSDFINSLSSVTDPGTDPAAFDRLTKLADGGNQDAIKVLTNAGYENSAPTTNMPVEQGLLNTALPGLLTDVQGDAARRALVAQLTGQATGDYNAARNALSPEANAARLAAEQAQAAQTGATISGNAATSAAAQLKSLQDSIAAMQGNLTGDLAAKASALQQQIASLTANLGTLDAAQKATLATQIQANQKNLEDSIAAQKNSLGTEIASLRTAADAQSVARAAALQKELEGLNAAQAPLQQARLDSANALATGVNLGLQSTNDALTAKQAQEGYLGGSSFDNAAMARAAIGARQQAAQALGSAREQNASDTAAIGTHGATEGRSIADQLAGNLAGISGQEATGTKSLADLLATGTQGIANTGAAGNAAISGSTNTGLFNVNNTGAGQTYQDQVFGADQQKALADALAKGSGGIGTTLATQQQTAADQTAQAQQAYFDNAFARGQAGILATPGLASQLTGTLNGLENYGNSGLNRTLGVLNWWGTNTQAPTAGQLATSADTSGNGIASLGANLLGSALKAGTANNWWQTPTTATPAAPATTPAVDPNASFYTNGGYG